MEFSNQKRSCCMIVLAVLRLLHFCFCFVNFDDILKPSHAGLDPFIIGFELQDEPYLKACEFSGGNVQDLKINQIE